MSSPQDRNKLLYKLLQIVPAFVAGLLYCFTLAPTLMHIDSGELAAVQFTAGVAHPTGYPLFTILGWLFTRVIFLGSPIFQLNVLALLFTTAGVYFFTRAALEVLDSVKSRRLRKAQDGSVSEDSGYAAAIQWLNLASAGGAALFLAFAPTVWAQSTSVEVYSLHFCLISATLWLLFKAGFYKKQNLRNWLMFAAVLGLAFSNHLTSIFLIPGIAVFYFLQNKISKESFLLLVKMLAIFIPVLVLIYAYLPIRAASGASINWGNPEMGEYFWRHVKGSQFDVWLFSSSEAASKNFINFWQGFAGELGWVGLPLLLLGMVYSWQKFRKVFWTLLSFFIFNLLYAINYDIKDLEPYFLLCYLSTAIWVSLGIRFTILKFKLPSKRIPIAAGALAMLGMVPLFLNFSSVNQSDVYTFEDYPRAALASLPENAVLLSKQWDFLISQTYYLQQVEGFRQDVAIIDKELLRRSWYYAQLEKSWPEVMATVHYEKQAFLKAVHPFERGERFDANQIEKAYQAVIVNLIFKNLEERPVYLAHELVEDEVRSGQIPLPPTAGLTPETYFFRLTDQNIYIGENRRNDTIRFPDRHDYYLDFIRNIIPKMKSNRAIYELSFNNETGAKRIVADLRRDHPEFPIPARLKSIGN